MLQLHRFDGTFSVRDIKTYLMEELGDDVPISIHFNIGKAFKQVLVSHW